MKSAGIVAEFNPLHKGHEYIISETRRLTGCESVCIAMSGNYVQRGEPAILDKWTRAETALRAGADLVIEIPTLFCLGNASQYATAGVRLLEALGTDMKICCGSESAASDVLDSIAELINDNRESIESKIRNEIKTGLSYPAAREKAIIELLVSKGANENTRTAVSEALNNPNDILALEYMLAANKSKVIRINREGAAYDAAFEDDASYQSAAGIRDILSEDHSRASLERIKPYVPDCCYEALSSNKLSFRDDWTDTLRYAVMHTDPEIIEDAPSGGEGLGHKLHDAALRCSTWEDIIMACKSKRYTYTRISRLMMQTVLGISRTEYDYNEALYIRVLGFKDKGRELLSEIKNADANLLPIITNINKEKDKLSSDALKMLGLDVKSSDVYNLVLGRDTEKYSDHRLGPIII